MGVNKKKVPDFLVNGKPLFVQRSGSEVVDAEGWLVCRFGYYDRPYLCSVGGFDMLVQPQYDTDEPCGFKFRNSEGTILFSCDDYSLHDSDMELNVVTRRWKNDDECVVSRCSYDRDGLERLSVDRNKVRAKNFVAFLNCDPVLRREIGSDLTRILVCLDGLDPYEQGFTGFGYMLHKLDLVRQGYPGERDEIVDAVCNYSDASDDVKRRVRSGFPFELIAERIQACERKFGIREQKPARVKGVSM